jgi:hypothetical protein
VEETEQAVFFGGIEDKALVHDAGDAVGEGGLLIGGKLETRPAHDGERLPEPGTRGKRLHIKDLSLCIKIASILDTCQTRRGLHGTLKTLPG